MPLTFDGETVDDTLLYYWSLKAISRALRFDAEAEVQTATNGYVLSAIASYYAFFHLGVFIACAIPEHLSTRLRKKIQSTLDAGGDPSRALSHENVRHHLLSCEPHGLPTKVRTTFETAQTLREFVNYGPDLKYTAQKEFRIFNRDHHPTEHDAVRHGSKAIIAEAVEWCAHNAPISGDLVSIAIQKASTFFGPNSDGPAYYASWSSPQVLTTAERHRASLEKRVSAIVAAAHAQARKE